MRIKPIISISALMMAVTLLSGCNNGVATTYVDLTPNSPYGKITDYNFPTEEAVPGKWLTFRVNPAVDFLIDTVKVNGQDAILQDSATNTYMWQIVEGQNKIEAKYKINPDIDFVDRFDLNIHQDMFDRIMNNPNSLDFRADGIEQMDAGGFANYVDGDTTHMETKHFGYTIKIRYLSIDTPESTNQIEEWGKTAALFNKSILSNAKTVILQSQGWARGDEDRASKTDGNGRNLAYVWYSELANPKLTDMRCLNLEMVYNGFSFGIGAKEDCGDYFYSYFDKALKSAQANHRGMFSPDQDPNFDYGDPTPITLKEFYEDPDAYVPNEQNPKQKLYKIEGYVSRKLDGAFYFQDQPSYERVGGALPEAYGMYAFTYAQTAISVGHHVSVVGSFSLYGGSYQIQGLSFTEFDPNPNRDTIILDNYQKHEIKPIEVDISEYNSAKFLDNVLVTYKQDFYCYNKVANYGVHSEGGIHEVNEYNEKYPFYNTSNKLICFAHVGSETGTDMRFILTDGVLVRYGLETSYTFRFFGGGTNYYYPGDATQVYPSVKNYADPNLIKTTYTRKLMSVVGISQNYISTSGATQQYQLAIVSASDVTIKGVLN